MNKEIKDFGEKIGGARKDLYGLYNIDTLNDAELSAVKRDAIWKRPNIQKLLSEGTDKYLLFWKEQVRKFIPAKPSVPYKYRYDEAKKSELLKAYIRVVNEIKDFTEKATAIDSEGLKALLLTHFSVEKGSYGFGNVWVASDMEGESLQGKDLGSYALKDEATVKRACDKERFGVSADDKKTENLRKEFFYAKYLGKFDVAPAATGEDVCYFADDEVRVSDSEVLALSVKLYGMRGTYYIYPRSEELYNATWQENTYVIFCRGVKMINIPSAERAEEIINEIVSATISANKAQTNGNRKKAFPYQLLNVKQEGGAAPAIDVDGNDYLNAFKFRGGEFGNWMNEQDRQVSLNMGYVSLHNLAKVLGVTSSDVSLGGELAIAFGARGHSKARAHYEPLRNVINLTKMSGAGALAHEWGHALDAYIGVLAGVKGAKLYTQTNRYDRSRQFLIMNDIIDAMQYKNVAQTVDLRAKYEKQLTQAKRYCETYLHRLDGENLEKGKALVDEFLNSAPNANYLNTEDEAILKFSDFLKKETGRGLQKDVRRDFAFQRSFVNNARKELLENGDTKTVMVKEKTDFYRGSKAFDEIFAKENGYWESTEEMFARAFDCYISDKLKEAGIVDTYLSGFANSFTTVDKNGNKVYAYPIGEERKTLNKLFDELIKELISENAFTEATPAEKFILPAKKASAVSGGTNSVNTDETLEKATLCAKEGVQMTIFDFI